MTLSNVKVIAFDADDTLWINEPYFQEIENKFCALLEDFMPAHSIAKELFKSEMDNLALYGYGVKGFILSMVETALRVTDHTISAGVIRNILGYGKELIQKDIELLDGIEHVLKQLSKKYKLVVATKGDLLDQERKLSKSGIEHYFHHTEIMSDKQEKDYIKLIKHLDIQPGEFMMIGNSIRSDIFPVLAIGAQAVHVPYHTTWAHEHVEQTSGDTAFIKLANIKEILELLPL